MQEFLDSLGQVSAVIGAQWGDEGKGKIVDILAGHFDVVARAAGGANAGHTIVVKGKKQVFRLLPSGCLQENATVVLGSGMVIHLATLLEEIAMLKESGIDILKRLKISDEAHILFDYHKGIDAALEEGSAKTGKQIGTTKRGIGPAYADKAYRTGIRMGRLGEDLESELEERAAHVQKAFGVSVNVAEELKHLQNAEKVFGSCITDTVIDLHEMIADGKTILIEGAQASLLDIDHGTYPYVTSSATTVAGALQGLGLPPQALDTVIGVAKAYCTRVGEGKFPTEADEKTSDRLRERGGEYGATTGRPRRCGWLHIPDLLYSAALNGFTHWNITKLDVLDQEAVIPVGVESDENGEVVFEELPGWKRKTSGITDFEELPEEAQEFLTFIEERTEIPVSFIGTGQGREEMIWRS